MTTLVLAEKPSLARAIADAMGKFVLNRNKDGSGYYEIVSTGDKVTWNFGHMLEQAPPGVYHPEWSKWNVVHLPYRIPASDWKLVPRDGAKQQLAVIKRLLDQADTVIHAGDPGREGQLLIDEVLHEFGWRGKTLRIKPSAIDPASMKKILAKKEDNALYANLYRAALCRARADWLVGMNLTVAATKLLANDVKVPVGRVQSPTLALVVRRDLEIENFVAKAFYHLTAEVQTGPSSLALSHNPSDNTRIFDKAVAQDIANRLKGTAQTLAVEKAVKKEFSPLPFSLPTFQKAAEGAFGFGAKESLDTLQALYDAKLTTYPRSDCQYLPSEQKADALRIANALLTVGFDDVKPLTGLLAPKDRVYNTAKTGEHHGIIPTGLLPPADLPAKLRKAWDLVARQFLLSLLPDYEYEETSISFVFETRKFSVKGEVPLNLAKSWRNVAKRAEAPVALPVIADGCRSTVTSVGVQNGKTTPPAYYTEATLIGDMVSVAKYVSDPKLQAILKNKENPGIGTVATQASIIERLKEVGMIESKGKKIISSEFGRAVVAALPPQLCDPGITAAWEDALDRIAQGIYSPDEFMHRIDAFIASRIEDMRKSQMRVTVSPITPAKKQPGRKAPGKTGVKKGRSLQPGRT